MQLFLSKKSVDFFDKLKKEDAGASSFSRIQLKKSFSFLERLG